MITLIIFTSLCTNLIINCFPATGVSTIKTGEQLNLTSQLVSPGSNFTLGFFTTPNTKNTYLGIWYTIDTDQVWVANPSTPINSSSGFLTIDPDTGKLIIVNGETTLINISNIQSGPASNLTATLEENGNFKLKNEFDNRILWQSFDYPNKALLPGMKLGSDLRTGQHWNITSWMSYENPNSGAFTLNWEPIDESSQRLMIRRRGQPYWTSGTLNNQTFPYIESLNGLDSLYHYNLSFVYNNEERYFSYHRIEIVNDYQTMWSLTPLGQIVDGDSHMFWSPRFCYGYDSGNGCVAYSNLPSCRSKDDQFQELDGYFTPYITNLSYDNSSSLSISDCMVRCWNNCSCVGFTSGTGCVIWTGKKSTNNFTTNPGVNYGFKYVLISPNPSKDITRIWAPVVAAFFLLLFCFGLVWYLKKRKLKREEERQNEYFLRLIASESFNGASNLESNGRKGSDLSLFSFASIVAATDNFASENKLGQGGFGPVYKGKLSDGREIAIKRLSKTSGQGLVEFKNELILIAKLQHTNLVRVLGCCIHGEEKMLIYEYMPNKSLDFLIFGMGYGNKEMH